MRLLTHNDDGEIYATRDLVDHAIPKYAILSHTWGADEEEVTLPEVSSPLGRVKGGYTKIEFCGQQALKDGLQHFWIDTCCIEKTNHVELSEAITSMFRWYQNATKCYVYLFDVSACDNARSDLLQEWEISFCNSRWFTRGWTLQELLAPEFVEFYSKDGIYLGDKKTLERLINKATDIPIMALRGVSMSEYSVEERLSWAARRRTTRKEDEAYCLQGLFGVFLPIMYGEREHAFSRLQRAIEERRTPKKRRSDSTEELIHSRKLQKSSLGLNLPAKQDDAFILQSFAFPEMCSRRLNVESRHKNTCEWIFHLPEYMKWSSVSQGLLWIKGKPGAGKSTLMAFLYDQLKKNDGCNSKPHIDIQLDFFFSARGVELQRTFQGMLRALLHQLLSQNASACQPIRNLFDEKIQSFGSNLGDWEWQPSELKSLLLKVLLVAAQRRPVIMFIDALDEAGEQSARHIAEYLHQLNQEAISLQLSVKIYLSCRHYPIMTSKKISYEVVVEKHNNDDIAKYVHDRLHLDQVMSNTPTERTAWYLLKSELLERARGVFQWVHLAVPIVQKRIDKGESPHSIRQKIRNVPVELSAIYTHILENIIDEEDRPLTFWLFQWACLAERPLTVEEMRYALTLEGHEIIISNERMRSRVVSLSGGLLEAACGKDKAIEYVQVCHQSVNDFMLTKGLALLSSLCGNKAAEPYLFIDSCDGTNFISQCQARLYWACLSYLVQCTNQCRYLGCHSQGQRQHLNHELKQKLPFSSYAAINIFHHAEKAANHRTRDLKDEIVVLQKLIPQWIKLCYILGSESASDRFPIKGIHLLHIASHSNMRDAIEYLLDEGADTNVQDMDGRTPLYFTALRNHQACANLLVRGGAKLDTIANNGQTPLVGAAARQNVSMVKWLLGRGADTCVAGPLHTAARNGHNELVTLLIEAGAQVNEQRRGHGTALQVACYSGHCEVVQTLLNAGADLNVKEGHHGYTLQAASYNGHVEVVQILLDAGADVNVKGFEDGHALDDAASRGHIAIVRILLDAGADVNAQGGYYGTALQAASKGGYSTVVKILLDAGADVNATAGQHGHALKAACYLGHVEVVRILLNAGADVNAQGGFFGNALHAAYSHTVIEIQQEIVQILLSAGAADVNPSGQNVVQ